MPRHPFGGSTADFVDQVANTGGLFADSGASCSFYTAQTSGVQVTDLTDLAGNPIETVAADNYGQIPVFYGPPDGTSQLWVAAGGPGRQSMTATDIPARVIALEGLSPNTFPVVAANAPPGAVLDSVDIIKLALALTQAGQPWVALPGTGLWVPPGVSVRLRATGTVVINQNATTTPVAANTFYNADLVFALASNNAPIDGYTRWRTPIPTTSAGVVAIPFVHEADMDAQAIGQGVFLEGQVTGLGTPISTGFLGDGTNSSDGVFVSTHLQVVKL